MSSQPNSDLPFLIAGGGIGGLATAIALAMTGRKCLVLEKRAQSAEDGAGIQIGPNGVHVLRALGVAGRLASVASRPDCLQVMDGGSGQPIVQIPLGGTIAQRHGAPYWTLHRQDLHAALDSKAQAEPLITVKRSATVKRVDNGPHSVTITLEDGSSVKGAALIAADGLWSSIRSTAFGAERARYSGKRAFRAIVPINAVPNAVREATLALGNTHIWLRPGLHAVHYPVRNGRELAVVLIVSDTDQCQGWSQDISASALASMVEGLPTALQTLFSAVSRWRSWPLMKAPHLKSWTDHRIALLGDAAHPVLPFLAQGAVLALEDAVVLADCISAEPDVQMALKKYEFLRRPRTERVARASMRNGTIYQLRQPMAALRNAALKRAPPAKLLSQYDWIYGWKRALSSDG